MFKRRVLDLVVLGCSLIGAIGCDGGDDAADEPDASATPRAAVSAAVAVDESPPLRDLAPAAATTTIAARRVLALPNATGAGVTLDVVDPPPANAIPPTIVNANGIGNGFAGPQGTFTVSSIPADSSGDIGPNHYVQTVDTDLAVFNRSGTVLYGPVPTNTLWIGFGGGCETNDDGQASVRYDRSANRWVITQFSITGPGFLQCIAVSTTPDPTGAYFRYAFSYTGFNDSARLAVWPDAYYLTYNMFSATTNSYLGAKVCALDRTKMLSGQPATQQCFDTDVNHGWLLVGDLDGATAPPAGSPAYIVALSGTSLNALETWKLHLDWTTPANTTFTGPTILTVPAYSALCGAGTTGCVTQPGTTTKLQGLGDRLMDRAVYRRFSDHEAIFTSHTVAVTGTASGMRWYELRIAGTVASVFQSGTYAPDASYRWMGSIAPDQTGNAALGFSMSSSTVFPSIRYTARLAADPAGAMTQGEGTIIAGGGSQTGLLSYWGLWSSLRVDPVDDCTFWYTNAYLPASGSFNWKTRIASFRLPSCGPSDATAPTTAITAPLPGATVAGGVTVTATASDNIGVTRVELFASGNLIATLLTPPYTTTWDSTSVPDGSVTMTSTAYDAANNAGASAPVIVTVHNDTTAPVTAITAPADGSTVSGTMPLTASASDNISVASVQLYVDAGQVASLPAPPYTTAIDTTQLADGVHTAHSVAADGSGNTATSPTISFTVHNAGELAVNGGFETGTLAGWTVTGPAKAVKTHKTGVWSVRVGPTVASTTDAVISQAINVPSFGTTVLRFNYLLRCTDYQDRQRAYLTDSAGVVLRTVLDTCSYGGWQGAAVDLTPEAGTTIWLVFANEDDGNPADPSWFFVDDVDATNTQ